MMTGTITVSELGGPIAPRPSGPSQPSAPTTHTMEMISPISVVNMSDRVRVKTSSRPAISNSARPKSGAIADSVASLYSSSITTGEMLLTCNTPSSSAARSLILRSAFSTRWSPVSRRRMVAIETGVPSVSGPGHGGESLLDLRRSWSGVDSLLSDRLEAVHLEQYLDQRRGGGDRIAGSQQIYHVSVADDGANQGVHLRESIGRERLTAEDERYDICLAGVAKEFIYLIGRIGDSVPGRKERHIGPLRRRRAACGPSSQQNGNDEQDDKRDVRASGDQPAQLIEYLTQSVSLHPKKLGAALLTTRLRRYDSLPRRLAISLPQSILRFLMKPCPAAQPSRSWALRWERPGGYGMPERSSYSPDLRTREWTLRIALAGIELGAISPKGYDLAVGTTEARARQVAFASPDDHVLPERPGVA